MDALSLGLTERIWNHLIKSGILCNKADWMKYKSPFRPHSQARPFYGRLRQEGRILQDGAWDLCTLFDVNFQPMRMTASELESGFRELVKKLYSKEARRERKL